MLENGCHNCKFYLYEEESFPCSACSNNYNFSNDLHWKYPDRWEAAETGKPKGNVFMPTVEEMNEVIQEHCTEHCLDCLEDRHSCQIEYFCDKVEGAFHNHPDECRAAYNILQETKAQTSNSVNHPAHYQGAHECIDEMLALFGKHAVMDFCRCNVYKYRYRAAAKNGQEDLDRRTGTWIN